MEVSSEYNEFDRYYISKSDSVNFHIITCYSRYYSTNYVIDYPDYNRMGAWL